MSITKKEIEKLNAYFRALNYISVGQLYLVDNPLLKEESCKKENSGPLGHSPRSKLHIYTS